MTEPQSTETPATPSGRAMSPLMWGVIGLVVVVLAGGGYYFWSKGLLGSSTSGPSVCETMVKRARDYGVVPPNTTLAQPDPSKNEADGRPLCSAQSGPTHYTMTADLICSDMNKMTCLTLHSVKQDDGTSLFQRQL